MTPTDTLREAVARAICDPDRCVAINDPDRPRCNSTNCDTYIKTDAALSAIEAAGWRVVPAVATMEMHNAAWRACDNDMQPQKDWPAFNQRLYIAMLTAAPRLDAKPIATDPAHD